MRKHTSSCLFIFAFALMTAAPSTVFGQDARTSIQSVLSRAVPNKQLPNDITLTGQVTDSNGVVRPFRITIKGKDQVKYEIGTGTDLVTTTQSKGSGWKDANGKRELQPAYSAIRRPGLVPFFDLLAEADTPGLQITDRGNFSIGNVQTRRFTLKLPDPTPDIRLFRRALDEETDVYVDVQSLLVVRSETVVAAENNLVARVRSTLEFADYRSVNGISIPFQIRNTLTLPGQRPPLTVYIVRDVTVNSGVPDSTFSAEERSR